MHEVNFVTASFIFRNCIRGLLKSWTMISVKELERKANISVKFLAGYIKDQALHLIPNYLEVSQGIYINFLTEFK